MKVQITPPHIFKSFILIMIGVYFIFPSQIIIPFPFNLIGIIFLISGGYMAISTKKMFKKTKTPMSPAAKPNKIHTTGHFKYSRNPMYLGIAIGLFGVAIITGSIINFVFPLIFVIIMNQYYIPIEEEKMEMEFGRQFVNYKKTTRRWI